MNKMECRSKHSSHASTVRARARVRCVSHDTWYTTPLLARYIVIPLFHRATSDIACYTPMPTGGKAAARVATMFMCTTPYVATAGPASPQNRKQHVWHASPPVVTQDQSFTGTSEDKQAWTVVEASHMPHPNTSVKCFTISLHVMVAFT